MKNLIKRQPLGAAALVLALVALSAALVVPAFAGKKGGKITTKRLANSAVTNPKIANNAVTDTKIANGAVTNGKLADGAVTSAKLGTGAVGAANLGKIETVTKVLNVGAGPNTSAVDDIPCPAGTTVISGGGAYQVTNAGQDIQIRSSFKNGNGWRVAVVNMGPGAQAYNIEAYCLD